MSSSMKLGCCAVNFRQYPLDDALGWIAESGFKYVELEANRRWCNHADLDSDPISIRDKVKSYGLTLSALSCARQMIDNKDIEVEYDAVADLSKALRWAKAAGIPVVHTGDGSKPHDMSDEDALEIIKRKLEVLVPIAEETGVYLCFEPHGALTLRPGGLGKILDLLPSKWLGVNMDTGNPGRGNFVHFTKSGDEVWMLPPDFPKHDEIEILAPIANRVRNVHFKDCVGKDAVCLGTGQVDLKGCVKLLHKAGFNGVLSWQTEGYEDAELTKKWLELSHKLMKQILSEVEAES